jgi:hypothetical protein
MENGDGYELFTVYGISIEYPSSWSVEVRRLKRDQGVVSSRSGGEECSCTLAWSPLEEVRRRFRDPGEQVRNALDDLKSRSRVEDLQVLEDRSVVVNGHEAVAMRLRATLKTGVFSRGRLKSEIQVLCVHSDLLPALKGDGSFRAARFPASVQSYICHLRGSRGDQSSPHLD